MGLTPRQEQFCNEYLVDLNAKQAAIRAGYAKNTAESQGSRLLAYAKVAARVAELKAERATRVGITADAVLEEVRRIAFADPRRVMAWGPNGVTLIDSQTISDEDAAAVSEASQTITQHGGSIRLKMHDKNAALEKLCKHLGLYNADESEKPVFHVTLEFPKANPEEE